MDSMGESRSGFARRIEDQMGFNPDWQRFGGSSFLADLPPMAAGESFYPVMNADWNLLLPQSLPHVAADLRFSCFNPTVFPEMQGHFVPVDLHKDHHRRGPSMGFAGAKSPASPPDAQERDVAAAGSSFEEPGHKRMRRTLKGMELENQQGGETPNGGSDTKLKSAPKNSTPAVATGKFLPGDGGGVEASKEEYIHVRARRGQATNSHNLAERVRREKISQRMKLLQELVPGCSKVTGKAVMLDEIINYVQSLQRQVEFLSMKLAAVNPRLEFDAESLLLKDCRGGSLLTIGSSSLEAHRRWSQQSQHVSIQTGIPGAENLPDAVLGGAIRTHLAAIGGSTQDQMPQVMGSWDEDLSNAAP